jgi:hypothetical protein
MNGCGADQLFKIVAMTNPRKMGKSAVLADSFEHLCHSILVMCAELGIRDGYLRRLANS